MAAGSCGGVWLATLLAHVHVEGEGFGVSVVVPGIAFQSEGYGGQAVALGILAGRGAAAAPESLSPNAVADHRPVYLELRVHRVRRVPDRRPHASIVAPLGGLAFSRPSMLAWRA
jgi:hypothetical protein